LLPFLIFVNRNINACFSHYRGCVLGTVWKRIIIGLFLYIASVDCLNATHLDVKNYSNEKIAIVFFNGAGSSFSAASGAKKFKLNTYFVPAGKQVLITRLILQNVRPQDIYIMRAADSSGCGKGLALKHSLQCLLPDDLAALGIEDDNVLEVTIKNLCFLGKKAHNAVLLPMSAAGGRAGLSVSVAYKYGDRGICLGYANLHPPLSQELLVAASQERVDCGCLICDELLCGCDLCARKGALATPDLVDYNPDDFKNDFTTVCNDRSCLSYASFDCNIQLRFFKCFACRARKKGKAATK
jgi:hypothetical protein